jgi:hypothetical protein
LDRYALRFATDNEAGERTVNFLAHSTINALDLAKECANGDWAELSLKGKVICKMRLLEGTDVWLIEGAPRGGEHEITANR